MKTTYLDNEITLLEDYKKDGTISHYQNRKLAEYKEIKQFLLHNVSQQRELLLAFKEWEANKCKLPWDANIDEIVEQYLAINCG